MLALVALVLAAAPDAQLSGVEPERATVRLELLLATALLEDPQASTSAGPPLAADAEVGFQILHPRFLEGAARPLLLLAVREQHSFYDSRDTLFGSAGFGAELGWFRFLFTSGFGMGFVPGLKPQPTVLIGSRLSIHLGRLELGLAYERFFQLRSLDHLEPNRGTLPGAFSLFASTGFDFRE